MTMIISTLCVFFMADFIHVDGFIRVMGPDQMREGQCILKGTAYARGSVDYGEIFEGDISGALGYKEIPRGIDVVDDMQRAPYHEEIHVQASIDRGRNIQATLRKRHRPHDSHYRSKTISKYSTCHSNSGGSGGSNCDPNGGGTGGGIFDELNDDTSCVSPILIDLGQDGFEFGGPDNPVVFDILGLGHAHVLQWARLGTNDAFLVNDLDGDGLVRDGSELFGNGTRMVMRPHELAINGYQGLAQWDHKELGGNEDGLISEEDRVWNQLKLWIDVNADGICESQEMQAMAGIQEIQSIPTRRPEYDAFGNLLLFWSDASGDGQTYQAVDVFFKLL